VEGGTNGLQFRYLGISKKANKPTDSPAPENTRGCIIGGTALVDPKVPGGGGGCLENTCARKGARASAPRPRL